MSRTCLLSCLQVLRCLCDFLPEHGGYDLTLCTHISAGRTVNVMLVMKKRRIDEANRSARAEAEVVGTKSDPDDEWHTCSLNNVYRRLLVQLQCNLFASLQNIMYICKLGTCNFFE